MCLEMGVLFFLDVLQEFEDRGVGGEGKLRFKIPSLCMPSHRTKGILSACQCASSFVFALL